MVLEVRSQECVQRLDPFTGGRHVRLVILSVLRREELQRLDVVPEELLSGALRVIRAYTELALFDLACDGVVMNRMLPPDALGEPFFASRAELEAKRLEEVKDAFAPLPVRAWRPDQESRILQPDWQY